MNPYCNKHPKLINWNKKWYKFLFSHFFVVAQKDSFFWSEVEYNKFVIFSDWMTTVKTVFVVLPTYAISVSLTIEIHSTIK